LKDKNFKLMRKWVADNIDTESHVIFRRIYDSMSDSIAPSSIPTVVLIIADYQFRDAFCADKEINVVACLTEIMSSTEFK